MRFLLIKQAFMLLLIAGALSLAHPLFSQASQARP